MLRCCVSPGRDVLLSLRTQKGAVRFSREAAGVTATVHALISQLSLKQSFNLFAQDYLSSIFKPHTHKVSAISNTLNHFHLPVSFQCWKNRYLICIIEHWRWWQNWKTDKLTLNKIYLAMYLLCSGSDRKDWKCPVIPNPCCVPFRNQNLRKIFGNVLSADKPAKH